MRIMKRSMVARKEVADRVTFRMGKVVYKSSHNRGGGNISFR